MRTFIAGENDADMRLSRFVQRVTHNMPDSLLYKSFRTRRVKVNQKRAAPEYRLRRGDVVELYLNDEFFPLQAAPLPGGNTEELPLENVVFEAAGAALLFKPAGMLSHGGAAHESLLERYTCLLMQQGRYAPDVENHFAPALCNRLDRGTEGLVIAAYTRNALAAMNAHLRAGHVEKGYLCVTVGIPPQGTHEDVLARDKAHKTSSIGERAAPPHTAVRPISTGVEVLDNHRGLALCQIALNTGRTHQIRAHMAKLGAPLLGDGKYGDPAYNQSFRLKNQLLCAMSLHFSGQLAGNPVLAPWAGRHFKAEKATLPQWWAAWKRDEI